MLGVRYKAWCGKRLAGAALLLVIILVLREAMMSFYYRPSVSLYTDDSMAAEGADYYNRLPVNCKRLHLAVPCLTETSRRDIAVLLKSALFHSRSIYLHLHLVIFTEDVRRLQLFFDTWELRMVSVHYHPIDKSVDIPSDILLFTLGVVFIHPQRILQDIQEVGEMLVLSAHSIFHDDIGLLTETVARYSDCQEMIYVRSGTYDEDSTPDEQATPDMLVWDRDCTPQESSTFQGDTSNYADEGVDNLANREGRGPIHFVNWDNSTLESLVEDLRRNVCCEINTVTIEGLILAPAKQDLDLSRHTRHNLSRSHEAYRSAAKLDGELYRTGHHDCTEDYQGLSYNNTNDTCAEYKYHAYLKHRTHLTFFTTPRASDALSRQVSLVTQLQFNRMDGLERLLVTWDGPAHVALYMTDEESISFLQLLIDSPTLGGRAGVTYHVVYKRQALVVPAFESFSTSYTPPESKKAFLSDVRGEKALPYHGRLKFNKGQSYTDYKRWFNATSPYRVRGRFGYEPYVVIPTDRAPMYEEILGERMRDKLPYTIQLEVSGVELWVLPFAFAVHLPHEKSVSHFYTKNKNFERCVSIMYLEIVKRISDEYPNSTRTDKLLEDRVTYRTPLSQRPVVVNRNYPPHKLARNPRLLKRNMLKSLQ